MVAHRHAGTSQGWLCATIARSPCPVHTLFTRKTDNTGLRPAFRLLKTELIKPSGPWRTAGQVEVATLHYIDWFSHGRLYEGVR
ncbi:MAG: hypothetical protein ACRDOK_28195 [Streptosporangiaceae bacterium]